MVIRRRSARALICSPERDVLLICSCDVVTGALHWATPGGGIEPGETSEQCLRREVFEETGLDDLEIGPLVWSGLNDFVWNGQRYEQEELFFLVNHRKFVPSARNITTSERRTFERFRWWSIADMRASEETVSPGCLAAILEQVFGGSPPGG